MPRKKKKEEVEKVKAENVEKAETEKVEEAKAEKTKKPEKKEKPAKSTKQDKVNPQIKQYFDLYIKNIEGKKIDESIRALAGICLEIISKANIGDIEYVVKKFEENKDKVLDIRVGLQGIQTLRPNIRKKVETLFVLIYNFVKKTDNKLNFNMIKTIIGNDKVVNWFSSKMKNNKLKKK